MPRLKTRFVVEFEYDISLLDYCTDDPEDVVTQEQAWIDENPKLALENFINTPGYDTTFAGESEVIHD